MAILSSRHANQQTVQLYDFSGGLNTTSSVDGISANQLSECVNMEIDSATNRLRTVAGTKDVFVPGKSIFAAAHDSINHKILYVDEGKTVYVTDFSSTVSVGKLTGALYPITANWEDGLLVASGGHLQYYNGKELKTIDASPAACTGVYIRAGRVLVTAGNEIRYSAVGDETNWTEDTNDASSSKFIEAGYKDGGKFLAMANLSSDILIFKDNRRAYRLSGEYPDWTVQEVSRNVECRGRRSVAAMAATVFAVGGSEVQALSTTQDYGDVKPQNIGTLVTRELQSLPGDVAIRYVPPLSQMWCLGSAGKVLVYDVNHGAWFLRQFNTEVIDVIPVGEMVYIVEQDRICKLDDNSFYDAGKPLRWRFVAKRLASHNEYLLKRVQVSILPQTSSIYSGQVSVGAIIIGLPVPMIALKVYHNRQLIHKNRTKIRQAGRTRGVYARGEMIFGNPELIYGNKQKIFSARDITKESRNVYRNKYLDVRGSGNMSGFALSGITLDISEV